MHFLISILKILLSTIIEKQIFCYQFPKQKKIYYYIFRRLIPFSGIRRLFYYHKGGFYYYDRYRKSTVAGPAPIGRSPGTEPSERAKGKNTQAHSDRGNSGKGAAGGADDRAASIGGISITKNTQKRIKCSEGLRGTGGRFLFPKGALTHHLPRAGGGIPPFGRARALSEGDCAFCGKRQTMPQHLQVPLSPSAQQAISHRIGDMACCLRQTCHRQLCRRDGQRSRPVHFLFYERETEKGGEPTWRFITWKRRWSAVGPGALPLRQQPI